VQRANRDAAQLNSPEASISYGLEELIPISRPVADAEGEHRRDPFLADAPQREPQLARGRTVKPLHVIDCNEDGLLRPDRPQGRQQSRSDRVLVARLVARLRQQERNLKGAPLPHRKSNKHLLGHALNEIGKRSVRQLDLRPSRPRRKNGKPAALRDRHRLTPKMRLPNARLALQCKGDRLALRVVHERGESGQFLLTADQRV